MRSWLLVLLVGFGLPAFADESEPVYGYKSYPLGESYDLIKKKMVRQCNEKVTETSDYICFFLDSYAGVPANVMFSFLNNQLSSITIVVKEEKFPTVEAALKTKYGSPSKENLEVVHNKMGVAFDNKIAEWHKENATILLLQRSGNVTESQVQIDDLSHNDEIERRRNKQSQKNAADI